MTTRPLAGVTLCVLFAGCTAGPPHAPVRPVTAPPPPATLVVPPAVTDWRDVPLTPGTWRYRADDSGSIASFGIEGAPPVLLIRCARPSRTVAIARPAAMGDSLTVTTSSGSRTVPLRAPGGAEAAATFAARDPFLDEIAFSRGRFSVGGAGLATLYLPAWAEPARVIEDCRG